MQIYVKYAKKNTQKYGLYLSNMHEICTKYARNMHKYAGNMQFYPKNMQVYANNMQ